MHEPILTATSGPIRIITINRPQARNSVDHDTALALYEAFKAFDADETVCVAILTGAGGNFCAGADLKAVATGKGNPTHSGGDLGPMGPSRLQLSKPVIAAVDGYAVAGGLELALWCDLRVASPSARFGVVQPLHEWALRGHRLKPGQQCWVGALGGDFAQEIHQGRCHRNTGQLQ